MMFFIIGRKSLIYFSLALFVIIFAGTIVKAVIPLQEKEILVIIDPGHGEPDGGCVGVLGTVEQKINLSVAKKSAEIMEAKNIKTLLTRDSSLGLWSEKSTTIRQKKLEDMNSRLEIIKKSRADLFISIHMNSYPTPDAKGLRIFYDKNHPEIKELAESIQSRMSDVTGAKTSYVKPAERNLFLLKNTPMPAILIECGFLTNPQEEANLNTSEYQAKLAWAIADAVEKYYLNKEINRK